MTVLMPSWYYEKKDLKRTPSIVGGLDIERESRYRREGARFIINVGTKMGLRYDTMATGVVYFHRFYMFHSFQTFPRYVTACCCLFLAGKVEETPKKCKDIIRIAKTFLSENQLTQFGDDPKEEVMTLERILLQTIKFDLQVDHPYGHLLKYAKSLKGDKTKLQSMVQMAWTFINDSLCTTLCLQWEPEVIAIALMYLAGKLSKFEVVDWNGRLPKHRHWWDMFVEGMSIELLEDICHQVLDLYSTPVPTSPQNSPPATPPTKSTRKTSQPPSPIEATTSPAQIKPKDPPVGQPIPRLEPGELKRKTSQTDKDTVPEISKIPRITEGKAIPTISSHSPKKAPSSLGSDTQPSSPSTPSQDAVKTLKEASRGTADPVFKSNLTSNPPSYASNSSFSHTDNTASKLPQHVTQSSATSFAVTVPPPVTTYAQAAPPFFHETQPFPNMQQPPPQLTFSQRPPMSFQHPPPAPPSAPHPPPPPGLHPSHLAQQYPPGLPPYNSQFPPPRHQPPPPPPPSLLANPPPVPVPGMTQHPPPPSHGQGVPPVPGLMRNVPPPPGVHPVRHMAPDGMYRSGADMYASDQRIRPLKGQGQDFMQRSRFDGNFRGQRNPDFDPPFPRDAGYRRPPPNSFNQDFERSHMNRRFSLDNRTPERGPRPSASNSQQQQGGPTGIPPVRITGR